MFGCISINKCSKNIAQKICKGTSVTRKDRQNAIKVAQKVFHWKNERFCHLYKNA